MSRKDIMTDNIVSMAYKTVYQNSKRQILKKISRYSSVIFIVFIIVASDTIFLQCIKSFFNNYFYVYQILKNSHNVKFELGLNS